MNWNVFSRPPLRGVTPILCSQTNAVTKGSNQTTKHLDCVGSGIPTTNGLPKHKKRTISLQRDILEVGESIGALKVVKWTPFRAVVTPGIVGVLLALCFAGLMCSVGVWAKVSTHETMETQGSSSQIGGFLRLLRLARRAHH